MAVNYSRLSNIKKVELLEHTVITGTPEDVRELYPQIADIENQWSKKKNVECSARALGIACRFKGLDMVKALVECGANFDVEDKFVSKYGCGRRGAATTYLSEYAMLLITNMPKINATPYLPHGIEEHAYNGIQYSIIPEAERLEIARWFIETKDRYHLVCDKLLYYSILGGNSEMTTALAAMGYDMSGIKRFITSGDYYWSGKGWEWNEWLNFIRVTSPASLNELLSAVIKNLPDDKLLITQAMFAGLDSPLLTTENIKLIFDNCDCSKINMKKLTESAIMNDNVAALSELASREVFKVSSKRDGFIDFASSNNKTQSLAWLLDYKNKTADVVKESKVGEKKIMSELSPNMTSVTYVKKIGTTRKMKMGQLH